MTTAETIAKLEQDEYFLTERVNASIPEVKEMAKNTIDHCVIALAAFCPAYGFTRAGIQDYLILEILRVAGSIVTYGVLFYQMPVAIMCFVEMMKKSKKLDADRNRLNHIKKQLELERAKLQTATNTRTQGGR